jgi:hemerythrin-like domain-containing protein
MKATDVLMTDHRLIEQVLDCLEKIVERAARGQEVEKERAKEALEFCRMFADHYHHGKEEEQLFPVMQTHGFLGGCSPIVVMLREHELSRLYVQGMGATVDAAAAGDPEALEWFIQHAQSYIKLMREHIHKEDTCLFPAANHALTDKDQKNLLGDFEKAETQDIADGIPEKYHDLANRLADYFEVPRAAVDSAGHGVGCGCGSH